MLLFVPCNDDDDGYVDDAAAYAAANETELGVVIESVQRKLADDVVEEFDEFDVVDAEPTPPACSYITAAIVIGSMKLKFGIVVDRELGIGGVFDDDGITYVDK